MIPYYDPLNDEIHAEPNSLSYYHEEGHRVLFKTGTAMHLNTVVYWMVLLTIAIIIGHNIDSAGNTIYLARIVFSLAVILLVVEEIWCWCYAFQRKYTGLGEPNGVFQWEMKMKRKMKRKK